jgi:NAD(P)H-hydrate epimerase
MSPPFLTRQQVRDVDRRAIEEFGMSGLVLMENAGRGCVEVLTRLGVKGPVVIACGKGNNAGDGLVIARHLDLAGIPVEVLLFSRPEERSGDALANYRIVERSGIALRPCWHEPAVARLVAGAEWIVDSLLGTGGSGPPRPPLDAAIRVLNSAPAKKVAVDLPSGLDCDSGIAADPTFRADHTCTFVAPKIGFSNAAAAPFIGQVHVIDIGVPRKLLAELAG